MNHQINLLLAKLNYTYTAKGVNAVARAQQIGHSGWYVFVDSDVGQETYLVSFEEGQWHFIRELTPDEYNHRAG